MTAMPCRSLLPLVLLPLALATGSLALLAESVRALLDALGGSWDEWARRRAAGLPGAYEYGGVKLAHAGGVVVAAGGLAAGFWLAGLSLGRVVTTGTAPGALGLAVASVAMAARCITILAFQRAGRRCAAGLLALLGLTAAALIADGAVAGMIDAGLGLCLGMLLVMEALTDGGAAIRDLIDHPLPPRLERQLGHLLHAHGIAPGEIVAIRSRRAGVELVLEVILDPRDELVEGACRRIGRARRALERSVPGLRVSAHWLPAD